MALESFNCKKPIELLTKNETEVIHKKSLEILKETGAVFHWGPALKALKSAGCNVDFTSHLVKFPEDIVENALKECPSSFSVKARNSAYDLKFENNRVYFATQAAPALYDLNTGKRRPGTIKDITEITIIQDALENIHAVFTSIEVLSDIPIQVQLEWVLAEQIRPTG